jgi:hypothetical protein
VPEEHDSSVTTTDWVKFINELDELSTNSGMNFQQKRILWIISKTFAAISRLYT